MTILMELTWGVVCRVTLGGDRATPHAGWALGSPVDREGGKAAAVCSNEYTVSGVYVLSVVCDRWLGSGLMALLRPRTWETVRELGSVP